MRISDWSSDVCSSDLLTRMAVEDIGLADPRALAMSIEAWDTYDRLGSPEGDLALAQLVIYLASTDKSNAGYAAFGATKRHVRENGTQEVPLQLSNAPTHLMKPSGTKPERGAQGKRRKSREDTGGRRRHQ